MFALFVAIALIVNYNSPDAQLERKIAGVIDESGSELVERFRSEDFTPTPPSMDLDWYEVKASSVEDWELLANRIASGCDGCTIKRVSLVGEHSSDFEISTGEGHSSVKIVFVGTDSVSDDSTIETGSLVIGRASHRGLWNRFTEWLPW